MGSFCPPYYSKREVDMAERKTPFELPTFKGYTIDARLKQFRKVSLDRTIEFLDFGSEEGQKLLNEIREYFSFLFE